MPYRGTNSKRNVVHDKARSTIKSSSRTHYLHERKEHDHELENARQQIAKLRNDGYRFSEREERNHSIYVTFTRETDHKSCEMEFKFPDNFDRLKEEFVSDRM